MGNSKSKSKTIAGPGADVKAKDKFLDKERSYTGLMNWVHNNVVGDGVVFDSPFGKHAVVYCDYTASGRPLQHIEEYINKYVYPYYANTHTTTSITAQQTTQFRHHAKDLIKTSVNASEDDVVIFTGSGTTGAINKLIAVLELKKNAANTVVFSSPFEHHSNMLPWVESGAEVIRIPETAKGQLDVEVLEKYLQKYKAEGKQMIASLSAASNITGILTDTLVVGEICAKYGALNFWDYATAAPYLTIDMNPKGHAPKHAVFCSPHKFVGGPGTPGVLIAKKSVFRNRVPDQPGGGTVLYVTADKHRYLDDIEAREEGGTPAIVESIRAGLVFKLKQDIDPKLIHHREKVLFERARRVWQKEAPNMVLLGGGNIDRLPIFSFLIRYNETSYKFLHHNFVAILLNDLFGIQARGGCACAGPYAAGLLGINGSEFTIVLDGDDRVLKPSGLDKLPSIPESTMADEEEWKVTVNGNVGEATEHGDCTEDSCPKPNKHHLEVMKPGFVRLNLPYFMNDDEIQYIIDAVTLMSQHAWKLLPLYKFDAYTGEWTHRTHTNTILSGKDVRFDASGMTLFNYPEKVETIEMDRTFFQAQLTEAKEIFDNAMDYVQMDDMDTKKDAQMKAVLPKGTKNLLWFVEPWQVAVDLALGGTNIDLQFIQRSLSRQNSATPGPLFKPRQMTRFFSKKQRSTSVRKIIALEPRL